MYSRMGSDKYLYDAGLYNAWKSSTVPQPLKATKAKARDISVLEHNSMCVSVKYIKLYKWNKIKLQENYETKPSGS